MQINLEDLRHHYASLSDDGLLEIDRSELTEIAQKCYDDECEQRQLTQPDAPEDDYEEHSREAVDMDSGDKPDWLEDAACACTFSSDPGGASASDVDNARDVLQTGGIPCYAYLHRIDPPSADPKPYYEYRVMVPGALNLEATSLLDKEIFNPGMEADWKAHFEALSDEEFGALNADAICAGLVDRIKRLRRAYDDELARRKLG